MARLSKLKTALHEQACELLKKDKLNDDEKIFVYENWQESAAHINGKAGAFFTPYELARAVSIDISGNRVIDLCAGIGVLSFAYYISSRHFNDPVEIVCVEINPDYVEVGKKLMPEATWICGNVLDPVFMGSLGKFDCAYGNPPFGPIKGAGKAPRSKASLFEYKVIDVASDIAEHGTFLIPQMSAPFEYSGVQNYLSRETGQYVRFKEQTHIELEMGCSIDTSFARNDWKGVKPVVEIVICWFDKARKRRSKCIDQLSLFCDAA